MKKIIPIMLYAIMFATVLCIPLSVQAKTKVSTPGPTDDVHLK